MRWTLQELGWATCPSPSISRPAGTARPEVLKINPAGKLPVILAGEAKASVLEAHMHGRRFVLGDKVTVADFVVAYRLDWPTRISCWMASRGCLHTWSGCMPARVRRSASPRLSPVSMLER
jgi:glutathione S-transferase